MAARETFTALKLTTTTETEQGRLFIAHDNLAPARGFKFYYVSDEGDHLDMGDERSYRPGTLITDIPDEGEIRLIKNGTLERSWRGKKASYRLEQKGVYRVEVFRHVFLFGWRPWIFSNPIYLR